MKTKKALAQSGLTFTRKSDVAITFQTLTMRIYAIWQHAVESYAAIRVFVISVSSTYPHHSLVDAATAASYVKLLLIAFAFLAVVLLLP
jgi:hypothetical protein